MDTQSAPQPPAPPPPPPADGFFASVRRIGIWRTQDRWAGGVAAGIAHRYGVDPLLVRGLFVVVTLFGGLGLVLYGLAWALLPEASDGRIHLEQAVRGWRFDIALAGAIAVLVVGLSRPVFWWTSSWWAVPWLVVIGAVIAVVLLSRDRGAGADDATRPVAQDATRPVADGPAGATRHAGTTEATGGSAGGSGWAGGPGWSGGAGWDGPHAPPPPGPPPPPPVPGPGSRMTSLVLAVCLLGAAGIALAHQQGVLDGSPWLVAGGAVLVVLGAGVLISGIRGRTQGGLGVLALLLAIVLVPAAAAAAALPGFARIDGAATAWAGDPTFAPTTPTTAEEGYSLVAGRLVVDLTALDIDEDLTVPASVTFGNLHLIVPDAAPVTIHAGVGGGQVAGRLDAGWSGPGLPGTTGGEESLVGGMGIDTTLRQDGESTRPRIIIDAEVGFGQIVIEEAS